VLVVEVQTQYLEAAKLKAATPDAGIWCLQDIGMPMKLSVTTPADLHKVLETSTVQASNPTNTSLDRIWNLTWGPAGWQNHAHQVHPKGLLTGIHYTHHHCHVWLLPGLAILGSHFNSTPSSSTPPYPSLGPDPGHLLCSF
jgi:hypothetical protein